MFLENLFCSKRKTYLRFFKYGRTLIDVRSSTYHDRFFNTIFKVYHLPEAEGARAERAAIGQGDYEPKLDIDRYVVECGNVDDEIDACPVFDRIREAIEFYSSPDLRKKLDRSDDDRLTLIRGGDGYMGVISAVPRDEYEFLPSDDELETICKSCKHCRHDSADDRDDVSNRHAEKVAHDGIIAFVKKLFTRKDRRNDQ